MPKKELTQKLIFKKNLYKYLVANVIIAAICLLFIKSFWILFFVMFFWGIDVLDKFFKAYSIRDYRQKMIEREISKMGE